MSTLVELFCAGNENDLLAFAHANPDNLRFPAFDNTFFLWSGAPSAAIGALWLRAHNPQDFAVLSTSIDTDADFRLMLLSFLIEHAMHKPAAHPTLQSVLLHGIEAPHLLTPSQTTEKNYFIDNICTTHAKTHANPVSWQATYTFMEKLLSPETVVQHEIRYWNFTQENCYSTLIFGLLTFGPPFCSHISKVLTETASTPVNTGALTVHTHRIFSFFTAPSHHDILALLSAWNIEQARQTSPQAAIVSLSNAIASL